MYNLIIFMYIHWALPVTHPVRNLSAMQETLVWSLGQEDPQEKGMAIHSSIVAWRIPGTEEPDRLQSMGLQRVAHDWAQEHINMSTVQEMARLNKSIVDRKISWATDKGEGGSGVTPTGCGVSLWGDENVLGWIMVIVAQLCEC